MAIGPHQRGGEFDGMADQLWNPANLVTGQERDLLIERQLPAYVLPYVFAYHDKGKTIGLTSRSNMNNLTFFKHHFERLHSNRTSENAY